MKVLVSKEHRQEAYRETPDVREHVTVTSVIAVAPSDGTSAGPVAHRFSPLFTYPRKYLSTRMALSKLNPTNIATPGTVNVVQSRSTSRSFSGLTIAPTPALEPKAGFKFAGSVIVRTCQLPDHLELLSAYYYSGAASQGLPRLPLLPCAAGAA